MTFGPGEPWGIDQTQPVTLDPTLRMRRPPDRTVSLWKLAAAALIGSAIGDVIGGAVVWLWMRGGR